MMAYLVHVCCDRIRYLFFSTDDYSEYILMVVTPKRRIVPFRLIGGREGQFYSHIYMNQLQLVDKYDVR
jgi:hypothetical protein